MNKYIDLIISMIILIVFYVINYFTLNSAVMYLVILFLYLLYLIKHIGWKRNTLRYRKDVFLTVLLMSLMYFFVTYLSGLFFGFRETIYSMNFTVFYYLMISVILTSIIMELIRYLLLSRYKNDKVVHIYITLFLIFINVLPQVNSNSFSSVENLISFLGLILLPIIFENILLSYLSLMVGYESNIIYLILMKGYIYIVPFIPNYNEYLTSMIKVSFPMIIFYIIYIQFYKKKEINIRNSKILNIIRNILIILLILFILLVSGYFRYFAITIGSESMYPIIDKGDIVIIKKMNEIDKIKEGDILAFNYNGKIIVHRIEQRIIDNRGEISFQTKGVNNNTVDEHIVVSDEVIGIIKFKLKYLGLPTIWLNEILK